MAVKAIFCFAIVAVLIKISWVFSGPVSSDRRDGTNSTSSGNGTVFLGNITEENLNSSTGYIGTISKWGQQKISFGASTRKPRTKKIRTTKNWTRPITSTTPSGPPTEVFGDPEETDDIELALPNLFDETPAVIEYNYVVIIDAGSSHTDLLIYKWPTKKINGTGLVQQENHLVCQDVHRGENETPLSSFRNQPELAGPSMKDCLNFASLQVPKSHWNTTQVLLGATAGLRVLREANATLVSDILASVTSYIKENYNFQVEDENIMVLEPDFEGGFSWISINYIKKILQENANYDKDHRLETLGSLDLGGASTQFTSEVTSTTTRKIRPSFKVKLFGHEYKVYTRSYLCYGKNEAYRRYKAVLLNHKNFSEPILDPCRPAGYELVVERSQHFGRPCSNLSVPEHHSREKYSVLGAGNGDECSNLVRELFQKTMDLSPSTCPFQDKECTFKGIEKGKVTGKFLGTGALYYDTKNLRVVAGDSFSLEPFDAPAFRAARQAVCGKSYADVQKWIEKRPELKNFFLRQCFDATYVEVLLGEVYNLSDEVLGNTTFAKKIDGIDVGWTLGWAVVASSDEEKSGYAKFNRR